jgi:hypothetical protein
LHGGVRLTNHDRLPALVTAALLSGAPLVAGVLPSLSLRDVLTKSGAYSVDYGAALASVIADEDYTQQLVSRTTGQAWRQRVLRSEIAFLELAVSTEWQAYRNVVAVDGLPVAGANGRLERLLDAAPRSVIGQARAIAEESARLNIGPIRRDFNAPTTALQFVHPSHQSRFRFEKQGEEPLGGELVWIVGFRERRRNTLIHTPGGQPVPIEGRLWITPAGGRIVRSTFAARDFVPAERVAADGRRGGQAPVVRSRAEIDVTWRVDDRLELWVPAAMRERYEGPWTGGPDPARQERYDIVGVATYSNYRRFTVDVRIIRQPGNP